MNRKRPTARIIVRLGLARKNQSSINLGTQGVIMALQQIHDDEHITVTVSLLRDGTEVPFDGELNAASSNTAAVATSVSGNVITCTGQGPGSDGSAVISVVDTETNGTVVNGSFEIDTVAESVDTLGFAFSPPEKNA